jgi:hypothetical protein
MQSLFFIARLILAAARHRAEIAPWIGFRSLTATALHGQRLRTFADLNLRVVDVLLKPGEGRACQTTGHSRGISCDGRLRLLS